MRRALLGVVAIGALLTGSAFAETAKSAEPNPLKVQALQVPLTETAQDALRELNTERDTFVQNFDWGTRDQLVAKQIEFQRADERYTVRGHEILRDMYQALGHGELAAFEQAEIERMERALAHQPLTGDAPVSADLKTVEAQPVEDSK